MGKFVPVVGDGYCTGFTNGTDFGAPTAWDTGSWEFTMCRANYDKPINNKTGPELAYPYGGNGVVQNIHTSHIGIDTELLELKSDYIIKY